MFLKNLIRIAIVSFVISYVAPASASTISLGNSNQSAPYPVKMVLRSGSSIIKTHDMIWPGVILYGTGILTETKPGTGKLSYTVDSILLGQDQYKESISFTLDDSARSYCVETQVIKSDAMKHHIYPFKQKLRVYDCNTGQVIK